jgi:hypothetical protein
VLCRPLSFGQADRLAVAIGLHPVQVWGADWLDVPGLPIDLDDEAA